MTIHVLRIPDDSTQRRIWLEEHLTGIHLGELVDELTLLHPTTAHEPLPLNAVLGDNFSQVLRSGLSAVPSSAIRQLLTHPQLLLELQEQVLEADSPYWNARLNANADLARLQPRIRLQPDAGRSPLPRRPWFVALTGLAATLLVAVGLWYVMFAQPQRPPEPMPPVVAWGWAKPGAIPQTGSPGDYYDALARSAAEWSKKRPTDAVGLARRMAEYRQGCSVLLLQKHAPLDPLGLEEKTWLTTRCHRWAYRLNELQTALEHGKPTEEILAAMDDLTLRIVLNLESRADHVRSLLPG